jgi:Alginate lyase
MTQVTDAGPAGPVAPPPGATGPEGGRHPRPGRRRARWLVLAAALALAGLTVGLLLAGGDGDGGGGDGADDEALRDDPDAPVPATRRGGYLANAAEVRERFALAEDGVEPYASAWDELRAAADRALDGAPEPEEPLDIPDTESAFVDDGGDAYALALAYAATGDERYAEAAADYVMAWVDTTETLEDTCPDRGGSDCQTSLVVSRAAPSFVYAADLVAPGGHLSTVERQRLAAWLVDVILPATSNRTNNWGDAGALAQYVITDFVGDAEGAEEALDRWRSLMDRVADDGHIPEETRRGGSGILYTQGALSFKVAVARIAERRGVDLWSYEGADGGSLREAVDFLARYFDEPGDWPFDDDADTPTVSPMWELAYARWQDPDYASIVVEGRPAGDERKSAVLYTTFTSGIPL